MTVSARGHRGTEGVGAQGTGGVPGALPAQVRDHATRHLAAAAALLSLDGVERGEPPRSVRLSRPDRPLADEPRNH